MTSISDTIQKRYSCRSYSGDAVEDSVLRELTKHMQVGSSGPFGNKPRFLLISMDNLSREEWKKLGTYGVIKNARLYLAGIMTPMPMAACDYGYCKEKLILKATELGIQTCWLGGTFSMGAFGRAAGLHPGELLPTVTPLGHAVDRRNLRERLMRSFVGSDHRLPWAELFFKSHLTMPFSREEAGPYREALENVRRGPSASNNQPWRVVYDEKRKAFDFHLSRSPGYKFLWHGSLQDIDMGIALCHFDLTAREMGLKGVWRREDPAPQIKSWEYIATWQTEA